MKKILYSIALVLLACSCESALDIVQENSKTASNMWKTSSDVTSSTNAIYSLMRECFVQDNISVLHWGELRVGSYMWSYSHISKIYTSREVLENAMTSSSASCKWGKLYNVIDQANAVIKYAPQTSINMSDDKREWALGQACFARAYSYFWAARIWGDVPLVLVPIESSTQAELYPVRAPKADVYAQIEQDIASAVEYSSRLGSNKYLATADAVNILKAEFALWMYTTQDPDHRFLDLAREALDAVGISATDSRLLADYSKIFDGRGTNNKNSTEVVFALQNNSTYQLKGGYAGYFSYSSDRVNPTYKNNPVPVSSTQYLDYGDDFLALLRESRDVYGDTRVPTNLGDGKYGYETTNGGVLTWPNKFIGNLSSGVMENDSDYLYYRYALAVMLDAELRYYLGDYSGAVNSLNIIAKRAYGKSNFYTDKTKAGVLKALTHEYFLEFPCEGVIWWALIRLDKIWDYNPTLKERKNNTNILLWPIHKDARNKNSKLTQTEGWY